ncbi:DUF58 domain-containing protein [Mobilitalea sibirica]|uniref:DUF58 domain-containing protein n=1 Tax=Mobilitalea sibirica TaxID=1462919 RepID=A0A8J7GX41_9FIRM|nr:DUF58 domain-containing protein [Mobilitalea sibirica]MBH1939609.1 DUF58 domain-containing protein [Mobilitalea sibirica]
MGIIYALIGALLLYQLQKYLYKRYWNKQLKVNLSISEDHAIEGEDRILTETIINKKLLPIPIIKVKFMTSRYFTFHDMSNATVSDNYYRNDLLSVMMYQKISRNISFRCARRGYYTIEKIHVVCSDLLVVSEYVCGYDVNVHLYVYPRPVDYNRLQIPFQKMLGTVLTKRFINEDPFEFKSIREYQSYDTLKTINWKASAKTGSLMVNVFDYTASQQIKIMMNLEPEALKKQEDLLEESMRIAAALAAKFIEQGVPTAFYTNALDILTKEPIFIPAGSGTNHLRTINESLARIDTNLDVPAFQPILKEECQGAHRNDYIVLISTYHKEDLQQLLSSMLQDKTDFMWIVPYSKNISIKIDTKLQPYTYEWEVYES